MLYSGHYLKGECEKMCPKDELDMRIRENLLHPLEMKKENGRLVVDTEIVVKEYSRSAAGKQDPRPCDLRPAPVLDMTVDYLLKQLTEFEDRPWNEIYDFIFDRLRSVRQDMIMQDLDGESSIKILERTVRFFIYSGYRLCEEPIAVFDSTINNQHIQECLKRLLYLYKETDRNSKNRVEFECLYMLFNVGHTDALLHYYDLSNKLRKHQMLHLCYLVNINIMLGNYVKALRLVGSSSFRHQPLLHCALHRQLPMIQRRALEVYSHGYNSKGLKYPVSKLVDLFWFTDEEKCIAACETCGLTVHQKEMVLFQKTNLIHDKKLQIQRLSDIDEELNRVQLGDLLIMGTMHNTTYNETERRTIRNET